MSDQPAAAPATDAPAPTDTDTPDTPADDARPKPTETVEFWKGKAREQEKRAKENAAAAQRLREFEDAQKTEAQRASERVKELEGAVEAAQRDALRFKVASKFGVSDEDADLFLTGSDEETLTKQAQRLSDRTTEAGQPRRPTPDPTQGRGGDPAQASPEGDFAAFLKTQMGQ